jgi:predicted nucleic acid-binding protein
VIVVDASVTALLFSAGLESERHSAASKALSDDPMWLAPEHWRLEMLSVIRGLALRGGLSLEEAGEAAEWTRSVTVAVMPTAPLTPRIWELRDNLTPYDAAYVALAEANDCTLVTADARIERAGVARCPLRVIR